MSIIVDLVIIGVIALFAFLGYKQGLIKAAIKILSFFIAIIIALAIYKPVSNLVINNTNIDDRIQSSITNRILPEGASAEQKVQVEQGVFDTIRGVTEPTVNNIAKAITVQIIETGVLLIIFIIIKVVLRFVTILADIIAKIPVLKQFNEIRRYYMWFIKRSRYHIYNTCSNISNITNDRRQFNKYY